MLSWSSRPWLFRRFFCEQKCTLQFKEIFPYLPSSQATKICYELRTLNSLKGWAVLRIRDNYPGSKFFPSRIRIFFILDPGSASKSLSILTPKNGLLSEIWFGLFIPDLDPDFTHPGSRGQKCTGPGSETLTKRDNKEELTVEGPVREPPGRLVPWCIPCRRTACPRRLSCSSRCACSSRCTDQQRSSHIRFIATLKDQTIRYHTYHK